jgi:tRNA (mo5U34)-methyltransferase
MKAGNEAVTEETRRQIDRLKSLGWYHSIELPNGDVIAGHQTPDQLQNRLRQFPIPADLSGKRVLDIGAWDGWFSFEMEKRGAEVVAIDDVRHEKFLIARDLLASKVDYHVMNVYDVRPERLGRFDIVLFLGVLYHLKHPLLALERVCAVSTDLVCVESYVTDDAAGIGSKPLMEFYEGTELCGQLDNWVGPNVSCLTAFCRAAGFARVTLGSVIDNRAHVSCFRHWEAGGGTDLLTPAPFINCVENAVSRNQVFWSQDDDYLSIWFKTPHQALTESDVFPEVGGLAARPVSLHFTGGDGWQAVAKLPPGLSHSPAQVKIRVRDSQPSNSVQIGVDIDAAEQEPRARDTPSGETFEIRIVSDGKTWERNQVRMGPDACISLWVCGLPRNSRAEDVVVLLDGKELPSIFVSDVDQEGLRQVNALAPSEIASGQATVRVAAAGAVTAPVKIEIVPG